MSTLSNPLISRIYEKLGANEFLKIRSRRQWINKGQRNTKEEVHATT